ncbi:Rid family detoxifying hydrolase [Oceanispirochaeta sp.]|jgi:2-iminobutanoate/2-iminopropanoate deaminase|uniref:Rid family detoxifying hydrolase n=1 Tax=Oceanispirochaeta sp. TaxID=2035350 RepID=UPI0026202584|nr:Rid family detoxifying hydrolase [Oceanispirochaeta sp.]MDA3959109.1 Rid family detoxifying hydrolase [Oceanispirochaeta sp.]
MSIEYIETENAPAAFGPFVQGVRFENLVITSGALPLHPSNGEFIGGDIKEQTRQTLDNLSAVLEAAGSSLKKVLLITVYMTDMDRFSEMNEVYASYFPGRCPARAAVGISALAKNAQIEMQAIAAR